MKINNEPCPNHKGTCFPESYREAMILAKYTVIHHGINGEVVNIVKTYEKIGVKPILCDKCRYFVFEK